MSRLGPRAGAMEFRNLGACRGLRSSCGDPCASCHACSRILLTGQSIFWGLSACNCIPRVLIGENRTATETEACAELGWLDRLDRDAGTVSRPCFVPALERAAFLFGHASPDTSVLAGFKCPLQAF